MSTTQRPFLFQSSVRFHRLYTHSQAFPHKPENATYSFCASKVITTIPTLLAPRQSPAENWGGNGSSSAARVGLDGRFAGCSTRSDIGQVMMKDADANECVKANRTRECGVRMHRELVRFVSFRIGIRCSHVESPTPPFWLASAHCMSSALAPLQRHNARLKRICHCCPKPQSRTHKSSRLKS
jgi:hypothetical protein